MVAKSGNVTFVRWRRQGRWHSEPCAMNSPEGEHWTASGPLCGIVSRQPWEAAVKLQASLGTAKDLGTDTQEAR